MKGGERGKGGLGWSRESLMAWATVRVCKLSDDLHAGAGSLQRGLHSPVHGRRSAGLHQRYRQRHVHVPAHGVIAFWRLPTLPESHAGAEIVLFTRGTHLPLQAPAHTPGIAHGYVAWLSDVSFINYAFEALVVNEFSDPEIVYVFKVTSVSTKSGRKSL
eukprot:2447553-Pyramimonas_sp.AAC.2